MKPALLRHSTTTARPTRSGIAHLEALEAANLPTPSVNQIEVSRSFTRTCPKQPFSHTALIHHIAAPPAPPPNIRSRVLPLQANPRTGLLPLDEGTIERGVPRRRSWVGRQKRVRVGLGGSQGGRKEGETVSSSHGVEVRRLIRLEGVGRRV